MTLKKQVCSGKNVDAHCTVMHFFIKEVLEHHLNLEKLSELDFVRASGFPTIIKSATKKKIDEILKYFPNFEDFA